MLQRFILAFALTFVSCSFVNAKETERLDVDVRRTPTSEGGSRAYVLQANGFVRATLPQVWRVLADYEHHPGFVPNLLSARIISRTDGDIVLEQIGRVGFLFVKRDIRLVVRITEHPMTAIDITLVSGDMKQYESHWKLTASSKDGVDGTRIVYSATMAPDFFVPPLIGPSMIQQDVRNMMEATMTEIEKRAAN